MHNESKILVIATGGTIASVIEDTIRSLEETPGDIINTTIINQDDFLLTELYRENCCNSQEFIIKQPYCKLSENLNLILLQGLLDSFIEYLNEDNYCGVVITHGTDTLYYTQSLFKYLGEKMNIDIPIEFAYSYNSIPKEKEKRMEWDGYKRFKDVVNRIRDEFHIKKKYSKKLLPNIELHKTHIIKVFPGIDFSIYNLKDRQYNSIILEGYHSCTVPVEQTKKLIDMINANIFVCSPEAFSEKYSSVIEIEEYAKEKGKKINFVTGNLIDIWAMLTLGLKNETKCIG
jgi:L-asparaginase/Glu-tRNA(Gln) amidotransferase subunit D